MSKTHKYISKKIILTNKKYKFHPYFEIPLKRGGGKPKKSLKLKPKKSLKLKPKKSFNNKLYIYKYINYLDKRFFEPLTFFNNNINNLKIPMFNYFNPELIILTNIFINLNFLQNVKNISSCKKIVLDGEKECFDNETKQKLKEKYGKEIDELKHSICKEELNKDFCIYKNFDLTGDNDLIEGDKKIFFMPLINNENNEPLLTYNKDNKSDYDYYYFNKYRSNLSLTQTLIKGQLPYIFKTLESKYTNCCILNVLTDIYVSDNYYKCCSISKLVNDYNNNYINNLKDGLIYKLCQNKLTKDYLKINFYGKSKFVIMTDYTVTIMNSNHATTLLVDLDNLCILYFDSSCIDCDNNVCLNIKNLFEKKGSLFSIPKTILKIIYNFVNLYPEIVIYINPIRSQTRPTCYLYSIFSTITMITNKITIPIEEYPYFRDIEFKSNPETNQNDLVTFFMKEQIPEEYIEYFILRNFTFDEPVNNNKNGINKMYYNNGDVYEGFLKDYKKDGFGTMEYINGDVYKGNWKDDKKDGFGTMTYQNGYVYKGNWKDDKKDGFGKMEYINGDVYKGNWKDDNIKENEKNVMDLNNGYTYYGPFKENEINGKGLIRKSNNNDLYKNGYFYVNLDKILYKENVEQPSETEQIIFKKNKNGNWEELQEGNIV